MRAVLKSKQFYGKRTLVITVVDIDSFAHLISHELVETNRLNRVTFPDYHLISIVFPRHT
jgi:hypothetical protein